jgi:hypothetical protein
MRLLLLTISAVAFHGVAVAAEKPDFSGSWRLDGAERQPAAITIQQSGTELNITSADGPESKIEVACTTMGKQCDGRVAGEDVKVSYWFNGPALIEMAIKGKDWVTETRRRLSEDGQKMFVEIIPIVPAGKSPEKLVFVREQQLAGGAGTK